MTTANILAQLGSAGVSTAFKNRIINGAMNIWQRGTTSTTTGAGYYTADRWASYMPSGSGTISQDTTAVPAGFQYGLRFTSGGASSICNFYQTIETSNCYDLAGQNATLSFYASGTAGVQVYFYIFYSTTTDAAYTSSFTTVARLTVTLTTTPTLYSITGAVPSGAKTIQISAQPVSGLSSGQYYSFTGVQLEVGTTATNFDYRPYGTELALCQRYYTVFSSQVYSYASTQLVGSTVPFKVSMRASPTVVFSSVGYGNCSGINTSVSLNSEAVSPSVTVSSLGAYNFNYTCSASAEL